MSRDLTNRDIINEQLAKLPGPKKMGSNGWLNVLCPFHDDSNPSCGVRIAEPALGVFNCLSCEAKGGWNKFAEKTGLQQIKNWNNGESLDDNLVNPELDDQLLGDTGTTFKQVMKTFGAPEATLWPEQIEWRTFPGWFMRKLGAHIIADRHNDSIGALFPIKVGGRVRGGVKAAFEKKKGSLSYITMKGQWAQDYGLFPYIYAKGLIRKKKIPFVVIVEGPRDAMRLCINGIPAVAVLGSKNVTKKKIMFVISMGVDIVYAMPDNDEGGKMLWKRVKTLCKEQEMPTRRIKLPDRQVKEGGKKTKMDPGNAPTKVYRKIMEFFHEQHGFKIPKDIY